MFEKLLLKVKSFLPTIGSNCSCCGKHSIVANIETFPNMIYSCKKCHEKFMENYKNQPDFLKFIILYKRKEKLEKLLNA